MKRSDDRLLLRSLDGALSASEERRVEALLADSAEARQRLQSWRTLRGMVGDEVSGEEAPGFSDRVMRRIREEAAAEAERAVQGPPRMRYGYRHGYGRLALAAVVVAIAVAGVLFAAMRPVAVEAPHGALRTVTLPGGSQVELSSGSRLTYRRFRLGGERRVALEGEAFFDVTPGRPFVVETFNAEVRVLGTRFNVRAWPDLTERETFVAVEHGRVGVQPRSGTGEPVVLAAGDGVAVAEGAAPPRPTELASLERVTAWRSGGVAFVDMPVEDVLKELGRRYAVRIETSFPPGEAGRVTYLNPRPADLAGVLSDICHAHQLRFRKTARGFVVLNQP